MKYQEFQKSQTGKAGIGKEIVIVVNNVNKQPGFRPER
jgi:hypothetical protein